MLSFGSAACLNGAQIDTFSANLDLLPDARPDPRTDTFWRQNRVAYEATRIDATPPSRAMPVFAAYPAGFDFRIMYWYMIRFAGHSPFSFSALDMKTCAMAMLKPRQAPVREGLVFGSATHLYGAR